MPQGVFYFIPSYLSGLLGTESIACALQLLYLDDHFGQLLSHVLYRLDRVYPGGRVATSR